VTLAHHRGGAGEPLLLVHGVGSQWQVWEPVLPLLEREREVVAVDLPGFGRSAMLRDGVEPTPQALAGAVAAFMDELGWETAHVAGNSLGGWITLELSKLGRTRSGCCLSPAGFAEGWELRYAVTSLRNAQALVARLDARLESVLARDVLKKAFLAQLVAHPSRMPTEAAVGATRNLARCPGWRATLDALARGRFSGGEDVRTPMTIAWGEKDRLLLPRQAERARAEVPQARHITLVGCGHVPTWDDPQLVTRAILSSASA
jgi:pimeloyl-ACP methyl ester carboxylesterase